MLQYINYFSFVSSTYHLAFPERFVTFKFVQIFDRGCFPYGNDETRIQNPLIPKRKPDRFGHTDLLCIQNDYVILQKSKDSVFDPHHYHDSSIC